MKRFLSSIFLFWLCIVLPPAVTFADGEPFLVRDLNVTPTTEDGLEDFGRVLVDGILYFRARHPRLGTELWRSDGTAEGTRLVVDLCRGSCSSDPRSLVAVDGALYFFADDGVFGRELWVSDGTRDGTRLAGDLCPGRCGTDEGLHGPMTAFDGGVLFAVDDVRSGPTLWRSDGTRGGTARIARFCKGECESSPVELVSGESRAFLRIHHSDETSAFWATDGTAGGTSPWLEQCSACSFRAVFNDEVFFYRDDPPRGAELWKSDGTPAGTGLLQDACPGACDGHPGEVVPAHGSLYFNANTGQAGPRMLFRSDGTPAGTATVLGEPEFFWPSRLTPTADGLLFTSYDDFLRYVTVWTTDGTLFGTSEIVSRFRSRNGHFEMADADGRLFFIVKSAHQESYALFRNDAGHSAQLAVFPIGPDQPPVTDLTPVGDAAFFNGDDGETGKELWFSDGTGNGTRLLADLDADPGSSFPRSIAALGDRVVFVADQGDGTAAVARSDGTELGTFTLGTGLPAYRESVRFSDRLVFSSESSSYLERGLWSTDGSPAGTELLVPDLWGAQSFVESGGVLYFRAVDPHSGAELWTTDASSSGTRLVADLAPGLEPSVILPCCPRGSSPHDLVAVDGGILFGAAGALEGRDDELWKSDGSEAGTVRVRDICEGGCSSEPRGMVRLADLVLFAAEEPVAGRELWRSDGTEEGTWRLADLRRGPRGSDPHGFFVLGGRVFFFARDSVSRLSLSKAATLRPREACADAGDRLWVSDGTEAGTRRMDCLEIGGFGSWVSESLVIGDRAFFVAANEATGPELWVTDGTAAGTGLLRDLRPGPAGSYPSSLTAVDGVLVFAAEDDDGGAEPWVSDGTAAGTRRLADVALGPASSSPAGFTAAGDFLYFSAEDAGSGRELWAIERAGLPNP